MQNVEAFFRTQVSVFDAAVKFDQDLRNDLDYNILPADPHNASAGLQISR